MGQTFYKGKFCLSTFQIINFLTQNVLDLTGRVTDRCWYTKKTHSPFLMDLGGWMDSVLGVDFLQAPYSPLSYRIYRTTSQALVTLSPLCFSYVPYLPFFFDGYCFTPEPFMTLA